MFIKLVVFCFVVLFCGTYGEKDAGLCQFSMQVTCLGEPYKKDKRLQSLCFDALEQVSGMYDTVINDILGDEAKIFKEKTGANFNLTLTTDDMFMSHGRKPDDPDIVTVGKEWNTCIEKSCDDDCRKATNEGCSKDYPACQELLGYCKDACNEMKNSVAKFLEENKSSTRRANEDLLSLLKFR